MIVIHLVVRGGVVQTVESTDSSGTIVILTDHDDRERRQLDVEPLPAGIAVDLLKGKYEDDK